MATPPWLTWTLWPTSKARSGMDPPSRRPKPTGPDFEVTPGNGAEDRQAQRQSQQVRRALWQTRAARRSFASTHSVISSDLSTFSSSNPCHGFERRTIYGRFPSPIRNRPGSSKRPTWSKQSARRASEMGSHKSEPVLRSRKGVRLRRKRYVHIAFWLDQVQG